MTSSQPPDVGERLQLFIAAIPGRAVVVTDETGRVLSWNAGAQAILGYSADEISRRHISCFYRAEDSAVGKPDRDLEIASAKGYLEDTSMRVRADGTTFWADVVISAIKDKSGALQGFGMILHDVDRQRELEAQLRRNEADLHVLIETVFAAVPDGIVIMDHSGRIQATNAACQRMFGYRVEALRGEHVKLLMAPSSQADLERELQAAAGRRQDTESSSREILGRASDGRTFPLQLTLRPADQAGQSVFVALLHDLSASKNTQSQLARAQRNGVVGHLAAAMAHELNNLLTVIVGRAEQIGIVAEGEPAVPRLAETIRTAGERGAELSQRLLDFSGPAKRPRSVDCTRLIGRLRPLMRRAVREEIELRFELSEVPEIETDPGDLEAVVMSAVLQGQDTLQGGGTLTLATATQIGPLDGGPQECVVVSIAERAAEGDLRTGLGPSSRASDVILAADLMRELVEAGGGELVVEGEPGQDRSTRIYLPLAGPRARAPAAPPAAPPRSGQPAATVFVVEDDPFVRSYAVACLESLGYRVLSAVDGYEALARLEQGLKPDVLFTDVVMPGGLNGWQVAARAQQLQPGLKVLFTTGYALETLEKQGRLDPGIRILNKPYRRADLTRHMQELLASADQVSPPP